MFVKATPLPTAAYHCLSLPTTACHWNPTCITLPTTAYYHYLHYSTPVLMNLNICQPLVGRILSMFFYVKNRFFTQPVHQLGAEDGRYFEGPSVEGYLKKARQYRTTENRKMYVHLKSSIFCFLFAQITRRRIAKSVFFFASIV